MYRNSQSSLLDYVGRRGADWLFRQRSPWLRILRCGASIFLVSISGLTASLVIPELFAFTWDNSSGTPADVTYFGMFVGSALMTVGAVGEINRTRAENKRLKRKRVLVIEERGLRDTTDTPLEAAVPPELEGRRAPILIDLRQRVADGTIVSPEAALERVCALPRFLEQGRAGLDRNDVSTVYGGLVSVPFAFLTGVLLDDESAITVFDWDRGAERWRLLDGADDGERFAVSGIAGVPLDAAAVILAVSVSYRVNLPAVRGTVGDLPLVALELPRGGTSCHWSEEKQRALAETFRQTVIALCNRRVQRIHLFIAAQNSVVFRFGRAYDKRNLPPVIVYQYEQSATPPFPWGVLMPTHGVPQAQIVRSTGPSTV